MAKNIYQAVTQAINSRHNVFYKNDRKNESIIKEAMFVLSFFLHSILFAGSALDSFQCLRSLLIVSFHVFLGLPHPRCPTTSNSVMLLIQPSFLTTCPNQCSRLYRNKVCMLLIPSFLRRESELMWSFKRTLHVHRIIARSLRCSLRRSLTLGAQHSLAYNKTVRIYVRYICPRVMYERAREVNIGKSSRNLPHADQIHVITLKSQHQSYLQGSRMNQQHTVFYLA